MNINNVMRAEVLVHALPYIKEYYGKTVVIKYGGNAMVDEKLKESVATDVVLMKYVGINPIIVHGGGLDITKIMKKMKKDVQFVQGLRITDKETMELVKMVLVGKVNKEIVALINRHGRIAVGVSGDDAELIVARKFILPEVDLGYVGEVEKINPKILEDLVKDGFTPVIASVGVGDDGQSYNINADLVAAEIASTLKADKLIFLTDVDGLYKDFTDKSSLISELSLKDCEELLKSNQLDKGMLPKVKGCVTALEGDVKKAHILNGTIPHSLLLEIFTDEGIGTMIITSR